MFNILYTNKRFGRSLDSKSKFEFRYYGGFQKKMGYEDFYGYSFGCQH